MIQRYTLVLFTFFFFSPWNFAHSGTVIEFAKCLRNSFENRKLSAILMDLDDSKLFAVNHCDIACAINLYQAFALNTQQLLITDRTAFSNSLVRWLFTQGISVQQNMTKTEFELLLKRIFEQQLGSDQVKISSHSFTQPHSEVFQIENLGGNLKNNKIALLNMSGKLNIEKGPRDFMITLLVTEVNTTEKTMTVRLPQYSDTPVKMSFEPIKNFKRDSQGVPHELSTFKLVPIDIEEFQGTFYINWVTTVDFSRAPHPN